MKGSLMPLKTEFVEYVKNALHIPLVGIAPPDDFPPDDLERISFVVKTFARATPLSGGNDTVLTPRDFLPEARSVIITGYPAYMGEVAGFEACREKLLGRGEPSHVTVPLLLDSAEKSGKIVEFFTERGFQCFSLVGGQFPIKLLASQCGVGSYGKNAIIQHPDFGSWISLAAYVTDAELEPDAPLAGTCGSCELCLSVCPTGALFAPYRCDMTRCLDFHLGHNKNIIPVSIREKSSNLMGEGCTACRDICPKNRRLTPIEGFRPPPELLHPPLLEVFAMTDEGWDNGFASTLMGFFLMDKKYLQRNAAIALGNFKDERAVPVLAEVLNRGDAAVRGYAAWALGNIGGKAAAAHLSAAGERESDPQIQEEIQRARDAARR
jgi:epoxyqueuosine reductase